MNKKLHLPNGAREWDLAVGKSGAEDAADAMTEALRAKLIEARRQILAGAEPLPVARTVRDEMYGVMDEFATLGARGVEPETTLVDVIEHALALDAWTLPRKD